MGLDFVPFWLLTADYPGLSRAACLQRALRSGEALTTSLNTILASHLELYEELYAWKSQAILLEIEHGSRRECVHISDDSFLEN